MGTEVTTTDGQDSPAADKTRDAVRSALERFTGGGQKPPVPDVAAPAPAKTN